MWRGSISGKEFPNGLTRSEQTSVFIGISLMEMTLNKEEVACTCIIFIISGWKMQKLATNWDEKCMALERDLIKSFNSL